LKRQLLLCEHPFSICMPRNANVFKKVVCFHILIRITVTIQNSYDWAAYKSPHMMRSLQRIVPIPRASHQRQLDSSMIIHEVTEPIIKPSSQYRTARIRIPATPIIHRHVTVPEVMPEGELATEVIYVQPLSVKSQTRAVHLVSYAVQSQQEGIYTASNTTKAQHRGQYISEYERKQENEQVFIPTPVVKVENEKVFIPSLVGKVENERVYVSSLQPKIALEHVYIPQPEAQIHGSTPPSDFAGAAKNDALTASDKAAIGADEFTTMSMNDNNISRDFQ
jgi:hypothetical protein